MKPLCLLGTFYSKRGSRRNREDGTERRRPHASERISIPWSFPSPSAAPGFPASMRLRMRHTVWPAPKWKRYCADPAKLCGTTGQARRPPPQKYIPALRAFPVSRGADRENHSHPSHRQPHPYKRCRNTGQPSRLSCTPVFSWPCPAYRSDTPVPVIHPGSESSRRGF